MLRNIDQNLPITTGCLKPKCARVQYFTVDEYLRNAFSKYLQIEHKRPPLSFDMRVSVACTH